MLTISRTFATLPMLDYVVLEALIEGSRLEREAGLRMVTNRLGNLEGWRVFVRYPNESYEELLHEGGAYVGVAQLPAAFHAFLEGMWLSSRQPHQPDSSMSVQC